MFFAQLRDVHQPVDIVLELYEGTEASELSDFSVNQITNLVFLVDLFPRVGLELLDTQADPLIDLIDIEHDRLHLVILLQNFAWMVDLSCPTQIGNVDHSVDALFELNEGAI